MCDGVVVHTVIRMTLSYINFCACDTHLKKKTLKDHISETVNLATATLSCIVIQLGMVE